MQFGSDTVRNAVHAAQSLRDAQAQCDYFFGACRLAGATHNQSPVQHTILSSAGSRAATAATVCECASVAVCAAAFVVVSCSSQHARTNPVPLAQHLACCICVTVRTAHTVQLVRPSGAHPIAGGNRWASTAQCTNCSLCVIKPHAVRELLSGKVTLLRANG